MSQFERTALLLGEEAIKALSRKKVAIFGLGAWAAGAARPWAGPVWGSWPSSTMIP